MLVRIQLKRGPAARQRPARWRRVALAFSSLLGPGSLMVAALGAWRLAAELDWADDLGFPAGEPFRWQYLLGAAAALQLVALLLDWFGSDWALHEPSRTRSAAARDRSAELPRPGSGPALRAGPVRAPRPADEARAARGAR